jgi:sugar fermentation stimulation protein A
VVFFLVQRGEAEAFQPADEIDPEYGRLLRETNTGGVEIMACRSKVTLEENTIEKPLKILL